MLIFLIWLRQISESGYEKSPVAEISLSRESPGRFESLDTSDITDGDFDF